MCCWASFICWLSLRPSTGHNTHAILFDAGSSGTRMEIYKFLASGPSLQPSDVVQIDASPNKVKPGIPDFSDDPTQVEAYMNPLLESAKQTIPEDKQVSTPIFLLATACMRLLPDDQANAILVEVRKLFNDKENFLFCFRTMAMLKSSLVRSKAFMVGLP